MPDVVAARLLIPIDTNAKQATAQLGQLDNTLEKTNKTLAKTGKTTDKTSKSLKKTGSALGGLKKALAGLGVALVVREFVKLTDTYTNINNKLKLVTNGTKELEERQKELFDISQKSRSSFQSTAELYARLSRSTRELNISNDDLLTVTDSINKAFIVSGASADEASNAIRQLSQGLAAGALRGDEFNSVAEQAPRLQEAIAKSLGVTVGELRALAAEGKITSKVIIDAMKSQSSVIDSEFAQLAPTFGQVAQQMSNATLNIVGAIGQELLPDVAKLGQAFIQLTQDGAPLITSLVSILKVVILAAKGVTVLALQFDRLIQAAKLEGAVEAQGKALERLNQNLKASRKEFDLTVKTRPQIVKALEDIANAQRKITESPAERARVQRAKEYLTAIQAQSEVIDQTRKDSEGFLNAQEDINDVLTSISEEAEKSTQGQVKAQGAVLAVQKKRVAATKEQIDAQALLAQAGDPQAFIESQRAAFAEQKAIVQKAGLDITNLEKFQQSQRQTQYDSFFKNVANNQDLTFEERQLQLQSNLTTILELENLSNQERLTAQQAFNQQSAALEQQRLQNFASNVQTGAGILGGFNDIANSLSQIRQNQISEEIQKLEDQGADEAVIAKKRAQLQRKAAQDQKRFATYAAILDTASAIASALTVKPFPLGLVLAGLAAARGSAQVAAIRSQPIPAAQFGGRFEVPPGNEADSGLLRVNQGEEVQVTPQGESGQQRDGKQILMIGGQEFEGFLVDRMQNILNSGKVNINRTGVVRAS